MIGISDKFVDNPFLMFDKLFISFDILINCVCCVTLMFQFNHFLISTCFGKLCDKCCCAQKDCGESYPIRFIRHYLIVCQSAFLVLCCNHQNE